VSLAGKDQENRLEGVVGHMAVARHPPADARTIGPWRSTKAANATSAKASPRPRANRASNSASDTVPIAPAANKTDQSSRPALEYATVTATAPSESCAAYP
jgi:hypothetical protein